MNKKIFNACYSILDNFSRAETAEIIEILTRYNRCVNSESDHRASCLLHGCKDDNSDVARKVRPYQGAEKTAGIRSASKSLNAAYSGPGTSTCSSCGRPL